MPGGWIGTRERAGGRLWMEARGLAAVPVVAVAVGLLSGCGSSGVGVDAEPQELIPESSTTTKVPATSESTTTEPVTMVTAEPTTTTAPPETTTTAPPAPAPGEMLRPGDSGGHVRKLQQKLSGLGYWLGEADGTYGVTTQQAVMAFQKAEGLSRDGVAGAETQGRLQSAGRPTARSTSGDLIEVDLQRQLMLIVDDGKVLYALNTSSGGPGTPTPRGRFTIEREIDGWRKAPLGTLYRPKYFNRGIALHGFPSVPGHPASHGCTRLSNAATDMLWASGKAEVGTSVWVY